MKKPVITQEDWELIRADASKNAEELKAMYPPGSYPVKAFSCEHWWHSICGHEVKPLYWEWVASTLRQAAKK